MSNFEQFGFSRRQLCEFLLGTAPERIRSRVVFAPCWTPESVGIQDFEPLSDPINGIWDCTFGEERFTYILGGVGAGICSDKILSLSETICQQILFLGSAGSICSEAQIGDFVVPDEVICADGLCRFLSDDLSQDRYGHVYYPCKDLQETVQNAIQVELRRHPELRVCCHTGRSISVETIYSQFRHIEELQKMNAGYLEMECAAFLCSAEVLGIDAAAVFCISDNAIRGESLITLSKELTQYRKEVRRKVVPGILAGFLKTQQVL